MKELKVIEKDLVPVYETSTGKKVVYGTELYSVLEVKSKFADWIKNRLNDCEALEDEDFEAFSKNLENGGRIKEYIIKLDTAKEMAMLERNEKGKQVRRYFIEVEKKYKNTGLAMQNLSPELQLLINMELKQKAQEEKLAAMETKVDSIRQVVAMDTTSWRDETGKILKKIGFSLGGGSAYSNVREESYKYLEKRMGVNLKQRLLNRRRVMADNGVSLAKRNDLSYLDIIASDKKLIEGYTAIVKEMAIHYGVA